MEFGIVIHKLTFRFESLFAHYQIIRQIKDIRMNEMSRQKQAQKSIKYSRVRFLGSQKQKNDKLGLLS